MSDMIEAKPLAPAVSLRPILMKRLFSISGIVPLGIYTIVHLWNNNYSWQGPEVFNKHLLESRNIPFYTLITILFLYIPLVFHTVYGLYVAKQARAVIVTGLIRNPYFEMLKYVLQRLSGLGLMLFLGAHIYKTKIETLTEGVLPDYKHMREAFGEVIPPVRIIYFLGVLGLAYHLSNGLWSACITWGLTINAKSQRMVQVITVLFFFVITAMGISAIQGFLN